jgi:ribonuclease HI
MIDSTPHYLLRSEASRTEGVGQWRFELRPTDGSAAFEVADVEPDVWGERLDLLTVVRALESLDRPSRVTLIGCTRYVEQGILYGVSEWRESGWRWEYFGQMVPVRDSDLWQRMDQVLQFHQVQCGQRRIDAGHGLLSGPHWDRVKNKANWVDRIASGNWVKYYAPVLATWCDVWMETASRMWQKAIGFRGQGSGIRGWQDAAARA